MPVQWVHLGAGEMLVASSSRAWIQYPQLGMFGLDGPMPASLPSNTDTMRNLLDGAIAAAERTHRPATPARMTAIRWAWELVNQWYISRHTIALLGEAAERYTELRRRDLAEFTRVKLDEERGDDEFPLADLAALSYDARPLVQAVAPSKAARDLIEYARNCVHGERPIDFLGYAHAIERHAIRVTPSYLAGVERVLPRGVDAVSGLRAHATDLDVRHVGVAIEFFANLPAADRTRIVLACHRATTLRGEANAGSAPTEAELASWMSPFRLHVADHVQHEGADH